jgi:signal transduction protein with GAF and PtsI domain
MELTHAAAAVPEPSPAARELKDGELKDGARKDGELSGVCAVPGFAVGRAARIERREIEVTEQGSGAAREREELDRARSNVRLRLERVRNAGGAARQEIISAHLEFLDDPTLNERAHEHIAQGKSAGYAWRGAIRRSNLSMTRVCGSGLMISWMSRPMCCWHWTVRRDRCICRCPNKPSFSPTICCHPS